MSDTKQTLETKAVILISSQGKLSIDLINGDKLQRVGDFAVNNK